MWYSSLNRITSGASSDGGHVQRKCEWWTISYHIMQERLDWRSRVCLETRNNLQYCPLVLFHYANPNPTFSLLRVFSNVDRLLHFSLSLLYLSFLHVLYLRGLHAKNERVYPLLLSRVYFQAAGLSLCSFRLRGWSPSPTKRRLRERWFHEGPGLMKFTVIK